MNRPLAWHVKRLEATDSTNLMAAQRVRALWQEKPDREVQGLVVVAQRQRAGRGQHGRSWESPPGGLYLSAVVEDSAAEFRDKLALLAGVAAATAEWAIGLPIGLRWPNDLMLAGKKIGGILCESMAMGQRWAGIIGIGLNVNTHLKDLSAQTQAHAISLLAYDGQMRDLHDIERSILRALAANLCLLSQRGLTPLLERARARDTLHGREVTLQDGERTIRGIAAGLGDSGELLMTVEGRPVACSRGTLIAVDGGPVRL